MNKNLKAKSYKLETSIIHVDGDSFFVSCEQSLNPSLRGKPVITGEERGIASAMSTEAKKMGIHRGMPIFKVRALYPEVIILPGDYDAYAVFAQRMYDIVRRYTDDVEEYSIDECFALLQGSPEEPRVVEVAREIKKTLQNELGMTFSLGLASTKVLAKVASSTQKPNGFTVLTKDSINDFLSGLPVGSIWGIGTQTSRDLHSKGIRTALEYAEKPKDWIDAYMAKPYKEIWHELRGESVLKVHSGLSEANKSISRTRSFNPKTHDKRFLLSQLSKNAEVAFAKLRRDGLVTHRAYCFMKTLEYRYHRFEISFTNGISSPNELLKELEAGIDSVYRPEVPYRSTGVTLAELKDVKYAQADLFDLQKDLRAWDQVYKVVDDLEKRFGAKQVFLGSSKNALNHQKEKEVKNRPIHFFKNIKIPYLGEVG